MTRSWEAHRRAESRFEQLRIVATREVNGHRRVRAYFKDTHYDWQVADEIAHMVFDAPHPHDSGLLGCLLAAEALIEDLMREQGY